MYSYYLVPDFVPLEEELDRLRDTIFGRSEDRYESWKHGTHMVLVACGQQGLAPIDVAGLELLEGHSAINKLVGYKAGHFITRKHYHSNMGGVLKRHRGNGIAKNLQHYCERLAKEMGADIFTFNTYPNRFREMAVFGLSYGFQIIGAEMKSDGLKINMGKHLSGGSVPLTGNTYAAQGDISISRTNNAEIARNIRTGKQMVGTDERKVVFKSF